MGDIKKLTEEHYRTGFRAGMAIASAFWILLLLLVSYWAETEIDATIDLAKTLLKNCYETTSH